MVISNTIEESIIQNIRDENVVFVFPTEVACKGWADWAIQNKDKTGICAVAMERFIAWDKFKSECIRTRQADKQTVPSLMRKIFASYLIEKNAKIKKQNLEKSENNPLLFKSLITSEFAENASSFSDWISKILPSLKIWKTYHDSEEYKKVIEKMKLQAEKNGKQFSLTENDAEDQDFNMLYEEYNNFLIENDLFDPAWEQPPFKSENDDFKYVIVYPQVLEDWTQYEYLLKMAEKDKVLTFINVPQNISAKNTKWCQFNNSVEELHNVALYLRDLHDNKKIAWTDISLSVPNMDSYGTYIERELNLFEIPNVMRFSKMLSDHGAGKLFEQIQDCVRTDYSFESIKALLLNDDIPWKNHYLIDKFILFGKKNNCVCSFIDESKENPKERKIDIWEESLKNPVRRLKDDNIPERKEKLEKLKKELLDFYIALKRSTKNMVYAKSFENLLKSYRVFRRNFIDRRGFSNMRTSDLILSRCISELATLVELEQKYCKEAEKNSGKRQDGKFAYKINNIYGFFVSHLDQTQYLDQTVQRGIQVYPYRAAAALPCKVHVIVDSTQNSLSVGSLFKQLDFLNEAKRDVILQINPETNDKFFKFTEFDPSECFISLYQNSSRIESYFTTSEHSINGYGFPHGFLKAENKIEDSIAKTSFGENIFNSEKLSFVSEKEFPTSILKNQKIGFENWKKQKIQQNSENISIFEEQKNVISEIINKKFFDKSKKRYRISPSNLKSFFNCPRQWLFEKVLNLKPLNNEADLMNEFVVGKINHAIFEEYLTQIKNQNSTEILLGQTMEIVQTSKGISYSNLKEEYKNLLKICIEKANERFLNPTLESKEDSYDEILSVMSKTIVKTQKNELFQKILPSIEQFSRFFAKMSVYKLEEHYTFYPKDENGNPKNYYFDGRIDCILKKQTEDSAEFFIIDFKSGSIPNPILFNSEKPNETPDFQMPIYKKLFEENEKTLNNEKIIPKDFYFFSLKNNTVNDKKTFTGLDEEKFKETCKICNEKIELFTEKIQNLNFEIDEEIQKRSMCTNKGFGKSCNDYQAICRRFFTVSGE